MSGGAEEEATLVRDTCFIHKCGGELRRKITTMTIDSN